MDYSIFKERINYLFGSQAKSISGLAEDLGMAAATLSRYLSGNRAPDLQYLIRISDHFRVSIDWLIGIDDGREAMNDEIKEIGHLFSISSLEDRKIVHAVLDKYRAADGTADNQGVTEPKGD